MLVVSANSQSLDWVCSANKCNRLSNLASLDVGPTRERASRCAFPQETQKHMATIRYLRLSCTLAALAFSGPAAGQDPVESTSPKIQDNSFLIEEAYNQERGVVQHISTFSRMWNSKDWSYTFTQEWPGLRNWRHQFSYTVGGLHAGRYSDSFGGLSDTVLNYRYQAASSGESRFAFAPRLSCCSPQAGSNEVEGPAAPDCRPICR